MLGKPERPHLHPAKNATRSPCSHEYPVPHSSRLERTHLDAKAATSWTRDSVNKACCREAPRRPPTDDICRMQDYFLDLDSRSLDSLSNRSRMTRRSEIKVTVYYVYVGYEGGILLQPFDLSHWKCKNCPYLDADTAFSRISIWSVRSFQVCLVPSRNRHQIDTKPRPHLAHHGSVGSRFVSKLPTRPESLNPLGIDERRNLARNM